MDKRYVLFYSKYCAFSRKVMEGLHKSSIRQVLVPICVDDKARSSLPATVQAVPTLIDRSTGEVRVGESIMQLVRGSGQSQPVLSPPGIAPSPPPFGQPHGMERAGVEPVIAPLNQNDGPYALMSGEASMSTLDSAYAPLSDAVSSSHHMTGENSQRSSGIESKYEQMMAERQKDNSGPTRV